MCLCMCVSVYTSMHTGMLMQHLTSFDIISYINRVAIIDTRMHDSDIDTYLYIKVMGMLMHHLISFHTLIE